MTPGDLLFRVQTRLDAQKSAKQMYADRLAPDFSPMDFMGQRENGLSRIIAWLLDPRGNHAQGHSFLVEFVDWLGLDAEWAAMAPRARVWLEVPTLSRDGSGFIDILVQSGGHAFAIENKPFATDQNKQVKRYLDDLAAKFRDGHKLLYLSGHGDAPSEVSISAKRAEREMASGTLLVASYVGLIEWLEKCLGRCRAPPVTVMIEGLIKHIRKEFAGMGDISESVDLARMVCGSSQTLEATLAILEAEAVIHSVLLQGIADRVGEAASTRGWHVIRSDLGPNRHAGLIVGFAPNSAIGFGFQFDTPRYGYMFYGVASENGRALPPRVKTTMRDIIRTQSSTDYWPAWKAVGPNDRHFPLSLNADREFWLAAHDGRVADMVISYVAEVEMMLGNEGLLEAVMAR